MTYAKNTCLKCKDEWTVCLNAHTVVLTEIDKENYQRHGELFGYCEDCTGDEYESVLV